jgi:hypothetical protein
MRKQDFVYTGLQNNKNMIYENVTNYERLEELMMFSSDPLVAKIPYVLYNFLSVIMFGTCEFEQIILFTLQKI